MTDQQIKEQVEVIHRATKDILSKGPEACRQFLRDAGINLEKIVTPVCAEIAQPKKASQPAECFTSQDIIKTFDAGYSNGNIDTGLSGHEYLLNKYGSKSTPTHRLWIEKSVEVDGLPEKVGMYITYDKEHDYYNYLYLSGIKKWYLAEFLADAYPDKNICGITHYLVPLDTNI